MKIRSAKTKGNSFEYGLRDSLVGRYEDIVLTKQEGFCTQHDLISHKYRVAIEAKKHKCFSWNELVKYYYKLKSRIPEGYMPVVAFQANRQPCLVMVCGDTIIPFDKFFGVPFVRHGAKKKSNGGEKNE